MTEPAQLHDELLEINEALVLGSLRQHELTEAANALNVQLQTEIAERKRVESALRESEDRYRNLFAAVPIAVFVCDRNAVIQHYNYCAAELLGPDLVFGGGRDCGSLTLYLPDGTLLPRGQNPMIEVLRTGTPALNVEVLIERPDGSRLPVLLKSVALKNAVGEITGAINSLVDITERKQADERQRLLTYELAHRGNNLLAVVQSIASQTLSGTRSIAEARDVLMHRLHALARSQSALLTEGFEGASVTEIIRLEFEGFSEKVTAVGHDVILKRMAAQTFTLLIHELATNAVKYGALSRPEGRIDMRWSIVGAGAEARFKFQWQERDGPPVVPPTRQGFGSVLINKAAAQDFGTSPTIKFEPEGFSYEIDAPMSVVGGNQRASTSRT